MDTEPLRPLVEGTGAAGDGSGRTAPQTFGWHHGRVSDPLSPYDGVVLVSFGGPERPEDVRPFLTKVTGGRGIPEERLAEVARHYLDRGGRSPINDQNRALLAALADELASRDLDVPLYWGNRNWHPFLDGALARAGEAGARRLLVVLTSAFSSYSGCRQYREDLAGALATAGLTGRLHLDRVRHYANHPGYAGPVTEATVAAARRLLATSSRGVSTSPRDVFTAGGSREGSAPAEPARPRRGRLLFVTHSLPEQLAEGSGPRGGAYLAEHRDLCEVVAQGVARELGVPWPWDLVFCSRSGAPGQPWLEPDVNDRLRELATGPARGRTAPDSVGAGVVVVPIGFVSDHMEVVFDLDTQARETAAGLGLPFVRAATVGTHPRFVGGLVDLLLERAAEARGERPARPVVGARGPGVTECPVGCCPGPRGPRPVVCGR